MTRKTYVARGLAATLQRLHNTQAYLESVRRDIVHIRREEREPSTETAFVRLFGDKVKQVEWSRRADFEGLIILGKEGGIRIERRNGQRIVRLLEIKNGHLFSLDRYYRVKEQSSLSNMQRGLLRFVY